MNSDRHPPQTRSAQFRFYEELNDFLPQEQRRSEFPYRFIGKPSVKDTVEAIGVPHTEIDLILVNGESVGFDYHMQGGERVAVYPMFESFDIGPLIRLRPKPLRESKFVVDVNLGRLAQKLRLLGFDSLFRNDLADDEIVELSLSERRIILTRDKGILKNGAVTHGYWVRSDNPVEQLREVIARLQLENAFKPFSRCSHCNALLSPVDKAMLQERLPGDTLQSFNSFVECEGCKKLYWRGSHYRRIREWVDGLSG